MTNEEKRLIFHDKLCSLLGSTNVYYSPPSSITLKYPAIIYSYTEPNDKYADDEIYLSKDKYKVMVVDKNPVSDIPEKIKKLKFSRLVTRYAKDNLNHSVFNVFI